MITIATLVALTALFWHFCRPRPLHPVATPQKSTYRLDERRIAVHESGHALASWWCTLVRGVESVTIDTPTGGAVVYKFNDSTSSDATWCHLVVALAGVAAELACYTSSRSGPAEMDLLIARAFAERLARDEGVRPPWPSSVAPSAPDFIRLYERSPSDAEALVLRLGYAKARSLIRAGRDDIDRLVALLLAERTVREPDLAKLFGPRTFVRAAGLFRATFVEPRAWRKAA